MIRQRTDFGLPAAQLVISRCRVVVVRCWSVGAIGAVQFAADEFDDGVQDVGLAFVVDEPHGQGHPQFAAMGRRPFRLGQPAGQPDHAVAALATAGDAIGTALAGRWAELPIMVRHAAAEHAIRPAGRAAASLSDLSAAGEPIAAAAVADRALEQLLVLLPLDEHLSLYRLGDEEARRVERDCARSPPRGRG